MGTQMVGKEKTCDDRNQRVVNGVVFAVAAVGLASDERSTTKAIKRFYQCTLGPAWDLFGGPSVNCGR